MADRKSSKAPAFQFYPSDFLSDGDQAGMSLQECGAYIRLICLCWNDGSIPNDVTRLARMVGASPSAMRKIWPAVRACFRERADGRYVHPRLEKERSKQRDYRRRQADAAAKRWDSHGTPNALPEARESQRNALQSSSSISDLRTSVKREKPASLSVEDEIAERAGRFIERYQALYTKHRKGAHYLVRPHLDFQKAVELCRTWPDARLDQLAVVFLTTDHKFAEEGSRTLGQFAAMASWCDGRLAEAGIA